MSTAVVDGASGGDQAFDALRRSSSLFTPSRPEIAATSQIDASDGPEAAVSFCRCSSVVKARVSRRCRPETPAGDEARRLRGCWARRGRVAAEIAPLETAVL
jgi:hypothetical protein